MLFSCLCILFLWFLIYRLSGVMPYEALSLAVSRYDVTLLLISCLCFQKKRAQHVSGTLIVSLTLCLFASPACIWDKGKHFLSGLNMRFSCNVIICVPVGLFFISNLMCWIKDRKYIMTTDLFLGILPVQVTWVDI